MYDIFEGETEVSSESNNVAAMPSSNNIVVTTPIFDLVFKKHEEGDFVFDLTKGLFAKNLLSKVCDQLCIDIARNCIAIQLIMGGHDALGKKLPRLNTFFNEEGQIKEQYKEALTPNQLVSAETAYAELSLYYTMLESIHKQSSKFLESKIQYMYVGNKVAQDLSIPIGPIFNHKEAIKLRIQSDNRVLSAKRLAQQSSFNVVEALEKVDVRALID